MTPAGWVRLEHAGWRWRARQEAVPRLLARHWEPPVDEASDGWRIVQRWGSRLSALGRDAEGGLFVKWGGPRHPGEALRFSMMPDRAAIEWRMNRKLAGAGFPVADCLAVGERRRFGLWRGSILVVRAAEPGTTLNAFLKEAGPGAARQAVERAAALVARLHEAGFVHHDLHGDNLLLDGGAEARLLLVDLHETTWRGRRAPREALPDLARLNAYTAGSRALRLRFWVRYARLRGLPEGWKRDWPAAIDRATRDLWERHRRKRGESIERY